MSNNSTPTVDWIPLLKDAFKDCEDLTIQPVVNQEVTLFYFDHLIEKSLYHQVVTDFLDDAPAEDGLERMMNIWNPVYGHNQADVMQQMTQIILSGQIGAVYGQALYAITAGSGKSRSIEPSQKETSVTGPHEAFIEDAKTNLSLIRRRFQTTSLKILNLNIGSDMPIPVYMLYIEGEAEPEIIQEVKKRLSDLRMQQVLDSTQIAKKMEDYPYSFFPQWIHTERPDTTCFQLKKGKVAIMTSGSPTMIIAPASFLEFFGVIGDVYERWQFGVFIRILRFMSAGMTLLFSAIYVAITTYHYQFIPPSLLTTIVQSRISVPFEPMMEALLMEGVIELLREASARLPSKIAQTIGVVGGLVIGQAVVQAGLAGNVLIVAVAAGALASFIMPSYSMETSFRILKFFTIIFAGLMGYYGILMFLALLITHLCHLTSLNKEYVMLTHMTTYFTEGREKLWNSLWNKKGSKQGG